MIKIATLRAAMACSSALDLIVIAGSTAVLGGIAVAAVWTLTSPLVSLIPRMLVVYS